VSGVETITVGPSEGGLRLDRWFKQRYPALGFGQLNKLLRTGQVRVDGKRAKTSTRLEAGQQVRVPPLPEEARQAAPPPQKRPPKVDPKMIERLKRAIVYKDDWLLVINKPAGLAVQGGSKQDLHLDGLLDGLKLGAGERPRLVHRLDKDTSGVLVLARSAEAARALAEAFRHKETEKVYWAVVVGQPKPAEGRIDLSLAKRPSRGGERVAVDEEEGRRAITDFRTLDSLGKKLALLELRPMTGRTHQLRAHCRELGTPILGDGKYGGAGAFVEGAELPKKLHLHARRLRLPHPSGKGFLEVTAPPPPHMQETFKLLGLEPSDLPWEE
jgi:23S rRNA pseudouridine955/2504/2580 synthase